MLKRNKRLSPGDKPLRRTALRKGDKPIRPVGKRGKRLRKGDAQWHDEVFALHGDWCVLRLPGCQRQATDAAHCIPKGGEWAKYRWEWWNGLSCCRACHARSDEVPEVNKAMREVALWQRDSGERATVEYIQDVLQRYLGGDAP